MTGVNLKEVNRISQISNDQLPQLRGPLIRVTQVISGWIRDERFLDEKGN